MASGLLNIPIELLYMIVEDGGLTSRDLKNLRAVHSGLNRLMAPRLFERIGFSFIGGSVVGQPKTKKHRTKRLQNVDSLRGSDMALLPRTFAIKVSQKAYEFPTFAEAFPVGCAKLDGVFPNVDKVELDVELSQVTVGNGRMLMEEIGQYAKGKSLTVSLSGMNYRRLQTLAFVPLDAEALRLRCTSLTDKVLREVRGLLGRSTNLKRLEIDGFGNYAEALLNGFIDTEDGTESHVPDDVFGRIEGLNITNNRPYSYGQYGQRGNGRGLLGPRNMPKFTNLKSLQVDESESEGLRDGRTLWDDLRACPSIKLCTLIPPMASDSLFNYLSSKESMSRLKSIHLKINVNMEAYSWRVNWIPQETVIRWGACIFDSFLPNVCQSIEHLRLDLHRINSLHHEEHREQYIHRIRRLSFIHRPGQAYSFPRLETLTAMLLWAPGAFNSFMRSIRWSPNLKRVDLDVHVIWTRLQHLRDPVLTEIDVYVAPETAAFEDWSANGVVMRVHVMIVGFWHDDEVREYKFRGKRWARIT